MARKLSMTAEEVGELSAEALCATLLTIQKLRSRGMLVDINRAEQIAKSVCMSLLAKFLSPELEESTRIH